MESKLTQGQLKDKLLEATENTRRGDLEKAIIRLKQILDAQPRHEVSLGMLASIYLQIGMHQQAISHFEALLDTYPKNPLARFQLGMARLANQEPEKALDVWAPMLDLENEFMANFHSALVLIQLGRSEEALPMVERADKYMPGDHPLYSKLQEIRAQLNSRPNANLD